MPEVVMEELGLEITKPYQYLYSFDSNKVKFLGLIKDMVVSLAQLPMKSVVNTSDGHCGSRHPPKVWHTII
jgi:hypothetical protein